MTKPIIVVKMHSCKLLYITQVKGPWPYLISKVLVTYSYNAASDWPCTFLVMMSGWSVFI